MTSPVAKTARWEALATSSVASSGPFVTGRRHWTLCVIGSLGH
ncbi:hypothetical protein F4553_000044 [Allocatelliglobosispora scoriae]|uniref:Uncharacterized protein n=1 Tax=Allocatelliglobosispora scoriae TaxID=643052 RepID=A0A841BGB1_9ACTN|nr:hypothetical protein [Allocatelliglobosispora scoriae]MBB5866665.1 hypothetical protein [Allocatelliglobosispora scoriae]